ncbi:hypothetical protein HK104_007828 [Borealophlyctis nickersoniae]|nr:hypothetical protein HK104_007828 [Borealophlyctis nickersoniae]
MAVMSCSNYPYGFFHAYRNVAERKELSVVVHLGDYIYEYGEGTYGNGTEINRIPNPPTVLATLSDYRARHAQYKTDADLQLAHAAHAFITVWDDHEFFDNSDGTRKLDERVKNGIRAYFEYLPIRQEGMDSTGRIYRDFRFGKLMDLFMLDTRIIGRDATDKYLPWEVLNPKRQMLGLDQEAWLFSNLKASKARQTKWRVIGQQIIFSQIQLLGLPINYDSWDGYPFARKRVTDFIDKNNIEDVVILSGE